MRNFTRAALVVFCAPMLVAMARAQTTSEHRYYAPLNSVAAFAEYSNSSSHIILGDDRQRKFLGLA
ncbi:MAG TPA: hypothetical protein VE109_05965, partial [Acidobacteriaceae bacterium]|nr:hypothetical protein [Acidobacteriaceae bacterium]